jgi:hypothetical protein
MKKPVKIPELRGPLMEKPKRRPVRFDHWRFKDMMNPYLMEEMKEDGYQTYFSEAILVLVDGAGHVDWFTTQISELDGDEKYIEEYEIKMLETALASLKDRGKEK